MTVEPRHVHESITPQPVMEGAGVRLKRSIGGFQLDYLDPFLLLDHFGSDDPADYLAGFPWHPHRGIETVTYMLAGEVDHRDSIGNAGRIGPGDVQWMTAGGGIMHEEMPQAGDDERMGGFQLWVNLPSARKMDAPRYQDVPAASIPAVRRADGTVVRVVAGSVDGVEGPVREIVAEPEYLDVSLPARASFTQAVPRGHSAFTYVFEGEGRFGVTGRGLRPAGGDPRAEGGGTAATAPRLLLFADGEEVRVETDEQPARFLLVSGKPLGEPIARYGPFVMTTRAEIEQALRDLRADEFVWRDDAEWLRARRAPAG